MKNHLTRLFLSLFIFLLSGYSQLYAHANQGSIHHSSTNLLKNLEQASFASAQNILALHSRSVTSERKKEPFKLKAINEIEEEEEEEVSASSKKHAETRNYFSTLFWVQTLHYFLRFGHEALAVSDQLSNFPSAKRHLLFQVFRI